MSHITLYQPRFSVARCLYQPFRHRLLQTPTFCVNVLSARASMDTAYVHPSPNTLRITSHNQYASECMLTPSSVSPSPFTQFDQWFTEASQAGVREPEAMTLSTCTRSGAPSSRILLLKLVDSRGFIFFTNYASRKSKEMEENPNVALAFHWKELQRQVRVVGTVEKISKDESQEYFNTRPLGSRLGAWASPQSSIVAEGEVVQRLEEVKNRFGVNEDMKDTNIPLPDFWGGWRVIPKEIEFWAGRPSRLHDRVRYLRLEGAHDDAPSWKIDRLAP